MAYQDIRILKIPIIVIKVIREESVMIQLVIPMVIKIKENSLIGISVTQVKKLFFFTCHINFKRNIIIIGFRITTKNIPAAINPQLIDPLNDKLAPKRMK